ncbi:hypothetical protein H7170_02245 [Candidatus Gracilibacteria bacterium]|nr:hypothetical protein [Candidatus Gracilibacteria bacterium]
MDTMNFSEMLPTADCPVRDAIYAIVEKMPGFQSQGLFEIDAFVVAFRNRFFQIVNTLPQDDESRKELEIELAHIQHHMNIQNGLIISATKDLAILRTIEENLTEEGVLDAYTRFSAGIYDEGLVIDVELFDDYLHYLHAYAQYSIENVLVYLSTLCRFSQVGGSEVAIISHLRRIGDEYHQDQVDAMIDHYSYLGGVDYTYDEHIRDAMEEDPELTSIEAAYFVDDFIEQNARMHISLARLWNDTILPYYDDLDRIKQLSITQLLNDFRDILDPEHFIPLFFCNGNILERIARDHIISEGRTLH